MKIKSIEKIEHDSLRYDIEVKDNHNFFANGLLVHNSCGILVEHEGNYMIVTRGSFASEQSIFATNLLNEKYLDAVKKLDTDKYTYVFEIIYPSNRIVCDYGDLSDLIFLARINKETAEDEILEDDIVEIMKPFTVVTRYPELEGKSFEELKALNWTNKEGFVLHGNGMRIKVKFEDYCRLHSIITNVTARDIWRTLSTGADMTETLENVPDEFDEWVRKKVVELETQFSDIFNAAWNAYIDLIEELPEGFSKKEFAAANFAKNKNKTTAGFVFALHDAQDISGAVWKLIFPAHEKPFRLTEEEIE